MTNQTRARNRAIVSGISVAILATCACATSSRPSRAERPGAHQAPATLPGSDSASAPSSPEGAEYRDIQTLFTNGAYEAALSKVVAFEKKYPNSAHIGQVRNIHGLIYFMTRRALLAIPQYRKAMAAQPDSQFQNFVAYNLAAALFEIDQFDEANQSLSEIKPEALDPGTRLKFHVLRARVYHKMGIPLEAAHEALAASRFLEAEQAHALLGDQLEGSLQAIPDTASLEVLYQEYPSSTTADLLLYRLGVRKMSEGKTAAAEAHFRTLIENFPRSRRYAEAAEYLRSIHNRTIVDGTAVGVLLPMKGKYAKYGHKSLNGIQLAFRIFNANEPASNITLVIEDAGDTPEEALHALNTLYFKHHVIAVLGPLMSKGVELVTQRSQELGLPILPLAQQPGVNGEYVFYSGMTPNMQAEEIARHAIEKLKLRRFAILHPKDKFGELFSQNFWDAVEARGGVITGIESYSPGETDFRKAVDKLSGLYYTEARQRELNELAKEREANNITKRTRKTEHYYSLKPIVDYDAVFIPDEPRVVGQILPTFAYRDVEQVQFLGISTWHSPELLSRARSYAEGSVFVDAFFRSTESPGVRKFTSDFHSTFEQDPSAIEALSFDAARVLEHALLSSRSRNRADIRDKLRAITQFPGVTGRIFYKDGHFTRELNILTVKNGSFSEIR